MFALLGLLTIVNLVLYVLVLIKLFSKEGVLMGILGIICGLYTFIWGWINHKNQGITNVMMGWTASIVLVLILQMVVGASSYRSFGS